VALEQLTDPDAVAAVAAASAHYAARNRAAAAAFTAAGVPVVAGDGLSLWVPLPVPARAASEQLMRRGWLARPGDEFVLEGARAAAICASPSTTSRTPSSRVWPPTWPRRSAPAATSKAG
jgi:hypothetical protein